MSFSLEVKTLLPALNFMKGFISDRDIIPAYKHFYFSAETLQAYMGSAGALYAGLWPKKAIPEPFSLPAESLVKILGSLGDQGTESVEFSDLKGGKMIVKGARFRSTLPVLTGEALTDFVFPAPGKKRTEVSGGFWADVERVLFSICQDETKPALRGLYCASSGSLVSTDGFRISVLSVGPESYRPDAAVIIPEYLLSRLGGKRAQVQSLAQDGTRLWFFLESAQVFGVGLEGAFPAARIAEGIKKARAGAGKDTKGTWVTLDPDASLDLLLARLLYFAEPPTFEFTCRIESKSVTLATGGTDGQPSAEETIPAKVQGPAGTFQVNGRYFREACQTSNKFWYGESPAPLYFLSPDKRLEHLLILLAK